MPHADVFCEDIEARSMWKVRMMHLEVDGKMHDVPQFERRVIAGPHRGRKVATVALPEDYFKANVDYEAALARLLADAEASYATLLEGGNDRDANAAA